MYVIHTPTEEEAKELLNTLHNLGYTWALGDSLIDHISYKYGRTTGYWIDLEKKRIFYGDIAFVTRDETLIEYKSIAYFLLGEKIWK